MSSQSSKKGRPHGAGTITDKNGHKHVRVSLPDGTRPWYSLCKIKLTGECTCRQHSKAKLQEMAHAISERERERVAKEMAAEETELAERRLTVQQFGELWTSGKLYERHGDVNGLKVKASAKDDEYRLRAYVYPEIGKLKVSEVTGRDIERVMQTAERKARKKLKRPWRKGSRFQLYQLLRRLFDLGKYPGRLRTDSPVPEELRPSRDARKLYGFLYPTELLALLGTKSIPLRRRVLYALAVYTGLRKGSLFALKWSGIDFQHRTLTSLKSKTGLPQMFEISEDVAALLQAWHEHQGQPAPSAPVVPMVPMRHREARVLRDDLVAAEVTRETLLGGADNIQPIRFHDLRATFCTWAMRQGRGDGWISDRTGHLTAEMRERYTRAARTLLDLKYEPFPNISEAIPELAEKPANVVPFKRSAE